MTKTDARKILSISNSADLKSAERAYHQKLQVLQLRIWPGNPCSKRQQAEVELMKLTDAWKTMQTKQPTRNRRAKSRAPVNRQKQATRTTIWDVIQDLAENWKILIGMTSLSKTTVLAILIAEFVLVMITLVLKSMKGV